MEQLLFIAHILIAITIIGLVLVQQGKGADIGSAFGGGASGTFFGSVGATSFLVKFTASLALCFFVTSLSLGYIASKKSGNGGQQSLSEKIDQVQTPVQVKKDKAVASDIPAIDENVDDKSDEKSVDEN